MLAAVQLMAGLATVAWGAPPGFVWDVSPGVPPAVTYASGIAQGMVPAEAILGGACAEVPGAGVWPGPVVPPTVAIASAFPQMYFRVPPAQAGMVSYHNPAARFAWRPEAADEEDAAAAQSPGPMQEVVATGSAPVGGGTPQEAREQAVRQALRSAVEQVAGVYVSSGSITQRFATLQDRITLHSEGFAVPGDVIEESVSQGVVKVRMRVRVSVRPLVGRLRELGLARSWKVAVALRDDPASIPGAAELAEAEITRRLTGAGFQVTQPAGVEVAEPTALRGPDGVPAADLLLTGTAGVQLAWRAPVTVDGQVVRWVPIYQGRLNARALRLETREVVTMRHTEELVSDRVDAVAATGSLQVASRRAARLLLEDLLALPAGSTRQIVLEVAGFERRAQAQELEDALAAFPGIRGISRRGYSGGLLTLEVEIDGVAAERLGTDLESAPGLKGFGLTVEVDTKARIRARARR